MLAALLVAFGFISTVVMTDGIFFGTRLNHTQIPRAVVPHGGSNACPYKGGWCWGSWARMLVEPELGLHWRAGGWSASRLVLFMAAYSRRMFAGDPSGYTERPWVLLLLLLAPGLLYLLWSGAVYQVNPCAHQRLPFTITH